MSDVYLHDIPLHEARDTFERALIDAGLDGKLGNEVISLSESAAGRVLAEPVWAKISSPHYHASAMDGFAVRAADTEGAMSTAPISLACRAQAVYVDTGDLLPEWANAVIPIEQVEPLDTQANLAEDARHPAQIRIRAGVVPWQHVRPLGEDIVATELVLPSGHTLRPVDLGAVAACGHTQVSVARQPRVAILPTGSELISIGETVKPGKIIEFNSLVQAAQITEWGGSAQRYSITPDRLEQIREKVQEAAETHDLVLLNAGSSAGEEDFSARVVAEAGQLLVHGVAVRPGHPVILGMLRRKDGQNIPVIGVPGYPVSAALTGEIFVRPLLRRWLGQPVLQPVVVTAALTRKLVSPAGDDDYVRMAVGRVGKRLLAAPLARGAGVITSLVRADGITIVPSGSQGLSAGDSVQVQLYRSMTEIEQTILAIGSHDISLDLMSQYLAAYSRRLASVNAGSQAGLVALRRGEAHLAGSHLLDPETGEYNIRYIKQYLPGVPVRLIALVGRQQGLLVRKGNPKKIHDLSDLIQEDVRFVNRQRGAGTRVLLDHHLDQLGIDHSQVQGYDQEEYTHLAVAAAVASGRADCGLGIKAAAQALALDFIPLYQERYDLVIPKEHAESLLLAPLFEVLNAPSFRQAVAKLPGYDIQPMGNLIAELE
jgi:putative molybdopterin biosynthesis protein